MFVPGEVTRVVESRIGENQRPSMDGKDLSEVFRDRVMGRGLGGRDWAGESGCRQGPTVARIVAGQCRGKGAPQSIAVQHGIPTRRVNVKNKC